MQFLMSYHVHKVVRPRASMKNQKCCKKDNGKVVWDFDVGNMIINLKQDAVNFWGDIKFTYLPACPGNENNPLLWAIYVVIL